MIKYLFAVLLLLPLSAHANDDFGARFSAQTPEALQDQSAIADILGDLEPAAGDETPGMNTNGLNQSILDQQRSTIEPTTDLRRPLGQKDFSSSPILNKPPKGL